ncbi:anaerobic ribonucleoside triphosphate reductase [Propionispora hippei]|uniref:Ribonucleoside-triphosphate reductase class III catalytic subunit n=1 Tax=Propionispora hippei DSM 15287 TaxID=1123003 RepID=A0A1M6K8Q0_9FIRM|nr:anaerobic ribonucleoside triphosphate reductase [Propionispora hippei]SHJ55346.1 ribonucleoside-triphosphate reductase class III catalytic subunit [Propionispora hippei DSM 15287]
MITTIVKRDGREVPFNLEKISTAINKALQAAGNGDERLAMTLAGQVAQEASQVKTNSPSVEEIQDIVEKVLIDADLSKAAKAYILYRAERTRAREMNTRLMKTYEEITHSDSRESNLKRDNANIDGDTAMGSMLKYGSEGAKIYNEMYMLKPEHAKAHRDGDIHIHDFEFYTLTTTCCQIDIQKLFKDGFSTGHGYLREPNDIASYSALACIAIQSNQNDQHGGQSIPNFDYGLSDGVRKTFARKYLDSLIQILSFSAGNKQEVKDLVAAAANDIGERLHLTPEISNTNGYLTEEAALLSRTIDAALLQKAQAFAFEQALAETDRATYQAMEALIHNLNTMHSRAGAQVPFSSINYGTDTSPEGRLVIKNVMLATEAGLGYGETPIFPIQIFKIKEGVNYHPTDPNYDLFKLACRVSAKRLFPNFSFIDAPFNFQYYKEGQPETEIAYMGCRTRVIGNVNDPTREIVYSRGNLSFTSINLPRLGIESNTIPEFYTRLDHLIDLCIDQLLDRFEIQCRKKVRNFPFLMGDGVWLDSEKLGPDDEIREVLKHGTLTVGFIGLAECLKALTGKHHGESEEMQRLGLEIIAHMRRRMDDAAAKYRLNFSLIATPAEGLSGRFIEIDRKRFGSLPGITEREYYTNSFHIPVYYPLSAFEKIGLEAPYHKLTNGGHITYIELDGDPSDNLDAFESVIRCMKEQGVGYGSINHPVDRDPVCGYKGIIGETCPKCGRSETGSVPFERIRRITGYLVGTLDRFNNAKRAEVRDRYKHFNVNKNH